MALRTIEAYAVVHDRNDRGDPYFPDLVDQAEMKRLLGEVMCQAEDPVQ